MAIKSICKETIDQAEKVAYILLLYIFGVKNDRRNSGGTLRQKETKRRQTES